MKVKSLSRVRLLVTAWTAAYQAPPSMGFSRQEYWSGLPFPSPGDLPNPGIKPRSPTLQVDSWLAEPRGKPPFTYKKLIMSMRNFFEKHIFLSHTSFPGGSEVKASAWNAGDPGSIPGSGRAPGEGNGNPLQYSCLENPMEGGAW